MNQEQDKPAGQGAAAAEQAADDAPQAPNPALSSAQLAWGAMLLEAFRPDPAPAVVEAPAGWVGKMRAAIARGWGWVAARGKALSAWLSGSTWWPRHRSGFALMLLAGVMCGSIAYVVTRALNKIDWATADAEQPAAVQTNPLAPLIARIESLDAQVAELQDQVDGLRRRQQPPASASGRIATPRPASSQSTQPSTAPERRRWGTTDLDREIDAFTQSLDTPTPLEPTK